MAGIYIHIPFCKQACHYCDFHFSTSLQGKAVFLEALLKEIELRKDYLGGETIQTIYLGGGTPSLLSSGELNSIFDKLNTHFAIDKDAEITLEVNPDDLLPSRIRELKNSPVNRLSIGVQSFREKDLKMMNRAHSSAQAIACIGDAQKAGFSNITIDLIYGLPDQSDADWRTNLHKAFELNVQHISSYCLTVEPRTALAKFVREGQVRPADDEVSASHFRILKEEMQWNEFIHYEISNFGKKDYFSVHNSNYWKGKHYLGLGPSAHSFDGHSRRWNVSNNAVYASSMKSGSLSFEVEELTPDQRYNEYVMTSLRTLWGCDLRYVREQFGEKMHNHCCNEAEFYIHSGKLVMKGNVLLLSDEGMLIADKISSDLFSV